MVRGRPGGRVFCLLEQVELDNTELKERALTLALQGAGLPAVEDPDEDTNPEDAGQGGQAESDDVDDENALGQAVSTSRSTQPPTSTSRGSSWRHRASPTLEPDKATTEHPEPAGIRRGAAPAKVAIGTCLGRMIACPTCGKPTLVTHAQVARTVTQVISSKFWVLAKCTGFHGACLEAYR